MWKKVWKKFLEVLKLWLLVYGPGTIGALVYNHYRSRDKIVVRGKIRRLDGQPYIIAANHEGTVEPILLVWLTASFYLRWPSLAPWSTPTGIHFRRRLWGWLGPRMLIVPDDGRGSMLGWIRQMVEILKRPSVVIIFPEGGRTDPKTSEQVGLRPDQRLSPFKDGIGLLVRQTGAAVIPVWVDGSSTVLPNAADGSIQYRWPDFSGGKRIIIQIGEPLKFSFHDKSDEIGRRIRQAISNLAIECETASR